MRPNKSILILALFFPFISFCQGKQIEFQTYYPYPDGIFRDCTVLKGLSLGDIKNSGLSQLDDPEKLKPGQIYIRRSLNFKPLNSEPVNPIPGQIIYFNNGTEKGLKIYVDKIDKWQYLGPRLEAK